MHSFDVLVIGGGPGGYVAAIRAAQLGLRTAVVDQWIAENGKPALGGTCLNVGCIPSKALLDSSHHFEFITHHAKAHGIKVGDAQYDLESMMQRKTKVVQTLTEGITTLFRRHKVEWLQGHARLVGNLQVEITDHDKDEKQTVSATHIIIATGSIPASIPQAPIDQKHIVDSTEALCFSQAPKRLGVIGAGVIGLELGSLWRRLGSEVIMLEALQDFLPSADRDIARAAFKTLTQQGLTIRLGARVNKTAITDQDVTVHYQHQGKEQSMTVDKVIVAVGRKPYTENLNLEALAIETDPQGFIAVDEYCRTRVPNVYALGDVVRGPMLAHKAQEEGMAVAEHIAGQASFVDHDTVPWVIYTWPEIAWVGKTEHGLKAAGIEFRSGSFPFLASGRARAMGETEGLVKVIADAKSDRVLGVHIFGANASELIAETVLAMAFEGDSEDIARTIHAHPTLAEALHEAALATHGRPLHI
ncbi:MAG: dihydrolipoyl dehydrogenase [Gammaproteobacteria bacterium]